MAKTEFYKVDYYSQSDFYSACLRSNENVSKARAKLFLLSILERSLNITINTIKY